MHSRIVTLTILALGLASCGSNSARTLPVVILVDPILGPNAKTRARANVTQLAKQLSELGPFDLRIVAVTQGNFGQEPTSRWPEEWRATAANLLPNYQAKLLLVYLAESQPPFEGLPFDNLAIVRDRQTPRISDLLTLWGVPPSADPRAAPTRQWLQAMAVFPLAGGLTQWSKPKTQVLRAIAEQQASPFGEGKYFTFELAGRALLSAHRPDDAEAAFAVAATSDSRPPRLLLDQASALRQGRKFAEALSLGKSLQEKYPQNPDVIAEVALEQAELGLRSEAEATLRAGVERFPQSAPLLTNLGALIIEQLGRREEGLELMQRAAQLDPANSIAARNLRAAREMSAALAQELRRLQGVTASLATNVGAWKALGVAATRLGRLDEAERAFQKAASLAPDDAEFVKYLQTVATLKRRSI